MHSSIRRIALAWALLLALPAFGAEPERAVCPSPQPCCVEGEQDCVDPGLARALLAGLGGAEVVAGATTFMVTGDSLNAGDPQGALMGTGLIGLGGALLGAVADGLSHGPGGTVEDSPSRPMARLSWSPGGADVLGEAVPHGLGLRVDPTVDLGRRVTVQPHLGASFDLGTRVAVDAGAMLPGDQPDTTFPVALRSRRTKLSAGAELALRLRYPPWPRRPLYSGAIELRYKPTWELRHRTLHPSEANEQHIEHMALYPATLGFRWHTSPRQRYTLYLGPRIDWISFSEPGSTSLRRGAASVGSFYGEAWYQLDLPLRALSQGKIVSTGRVNLGYIHSNLDNQRLDVGAVVGYFGPMELSMDLRLRRRGAPFAVQLTGGYRLATGGGPFLEVGYVPGRSQP